jgi:hypothetical protein
MDTNNIKVVVYNLNTDESETVIVGLDSEGSVFEPPFTFTCYSRDTREVVVNWVKDGLTQVEWVTAGDYEIIPVKGVLYEVSVETID